MVKIMFVLHERAGMSLSDAHTYWGTKHADILRKVPKVKSYVQSHALTALDGAKTPVLGFAELSFDSEADYAFAMASPEMAAGFADVQNFADETRVDAAVVRDTKAI